MSPSTSTAARASSSPRAARRRTAAALLAAALLVVPMTFGPGPAAALPPSCGLAGDGTELSPYEVANGTHLALVGVDGCELDAYYLQTASFTLTGAHTPIGTSGEPFEGVYDGGGNTITGLTIDGRAASLGLVGLFAAADGAEFKDLTLAGVDVSGPAGDGCVGTLVGGVGGASIENVHVSGEATGAVLDFADAVGGLVGCAFDSEIVDSSADVEVVGLGDSVGGLIGYAEEVYIGRSWASGDVTGVGSVGGLVGYADRGTVVEGSWASGDVQASGSSAGGLIGYSEATITDSYATGDVVGTGSDSYGGLVGGHASPAGPIRRSYATGNVSGTSYVGGLVGYTSNADLEDVYAHGDVTATTSVYVGGLVGQVVGRVVRAYSIGLVTSPSGAESNGLIGNVQGTTIEVVASFWDVDTSGFTTGTDRDPDPAVGLPSAGMKLLATYVDADWDIVARVQEPNEDGSPVWGILAGRNGGYPFLQALVGTSSAEPSTGSSSASAIALACAPAVAVAGGRVTCTVTGGEPDIDILWRAAYNPVIAEAGVTLDADGAGSFSFVVPRAALGQPLTVELVEWTAPVSLGVVAGPVPGGVPAGEGSSLPAGWLVVLVGFAAAVVMRRAVGMAA